MPLCRHGHTSETADYCDECGTPIDAGTATPAGGTPAAPDPCPLCGTPRAGRFCEEDGYDFVLAPPVSTTPSASPSASDASSLALNASNSPSSIEAEAPPVEAGATTWEIEVEADERWFAIVADRRGPDFARVVFPQYYPRTVIPLRGSEMRIGRVRGASSPPDIDLTGPPSDPGVSRLHAVLLAGPDGWSVLDPGSTNGTSINYDEEPIATDTPVALSEGDRVHVGAYTTLRLRRSDGGA